MPEAGQRNEIEFDFNDKTIRGWIFEPDTPQPWPVIVMAHGFSGVKEQRLDWFADSFRQAGFAVLVFDFPNLGASDGEIRGDIDPEEQLAAFGAAITFVAGLDGIDPQRLGIWGTSYSGGHVLRLAATDRRVACAVAQVPHVGISFDVPAAIDEMFSAERARRASGEAPMMIPVVGGGGGMAALPTPDAELWANNLAEVAPAWRNEVTLSSVDRMLHYKPADQIEAIAPIPLMIVCAENDSLIPASLVHEVFARAGEPKALVSINCGHFDVYEPNFDEAVEPERAWFAEHLL